MPTYLAFLRAVNVGNRPYPMAELRQTLADAGFEEVQTHIQTGNVRIRTALRSRAKVGAALEKAFEQDRGFEVPTVVFTAREIAGIVADAESIPGPAPKHGHYVELLRTAPNAAQRALIQGQQHPGQRAVVKGRAVHLLFDVPYHKAKGPSAEVRRAIGDSTNRNLTVLKAIAVKWAP